MMTNAKKRVLLGLLILFSLPLTAVTLKTNVGPLFLKAESMFEGEKIKTTNFYGLEALAELNFESVVLKTDLAAATGDRSYLGGSFSWGYEFCLDQLSITPLAGIGGQALRTSAPMDEFWDDTSERRLSRLKFIGIELAYTFESCRFSFFYACTWSYTKIHLNYDFIELILKEYVKGGNILSMRADYYITPCASIGLKATLDNSYIKKRHGLRMYSVTLWGGYTF